MYEFTVFKTLLNLIYPRVCASCQKTALLDSSSPICFNCILELPIIGFKPIEQKKTRQKFDGKVKVVDVLSLLKYEKQNVTQQLIYELKYRGNQELAYWLGKKMAKEFLNSYKQVKYDLIIPIPLHKLRLKKRGFNQAAVIAKGISDVLGIEILEEGLIRNVNTSTQTKKTRYERFKNANQIFSVSPSVEIRGKHICLVDDVLTTGATLVTAAETLIENGCLEVSIMTIASAY